MVNQCLPRVPTRRFRAKQRVLVLFDGDNFKFLMNSIGRIDIAKLSKILVGRRICTAVIYFMSVSTKNPEPVQRFIHVLESNSIRVIDSPKKFRRNSKTGETFYKGYPDAKIWRYALEHLDEFDTLLIVTRDGDFIEMIEHFRNFQHKRVEICSYPEDMDANLEKVVDDYHDLSDPHLLKRIKLAKTEVIDPQEWAALLDIFSQEANAELEAEAAEPPEENAASHAA